MPTGRHYAHITFEMRVAIENYVIEGRTLAHMSRELGVDATSVSRELRRNRRSDGFSAHPSLRNRCARRKSCSRRRICDPECPRKCSSCGRACREGGCPDWEEGSCRRTSRAPWVCNGCPERPRCPLERFTYSAKVAQAKADARLSESRQGVDMTGREMAFLAGAVREGLAKGQSVHHIFASRDDLPCSERSFYRHVENEAIDIHKMELRKKVRYRKRKRARPAGRDTGVFEGRTHADYLALDAGLRAAAVQMDCVEGVEGDSRAILTLHFAAIRFQAYILLERKDSAHVVAALDWLESLLGGPGAFRRVLGTVLADRGAEFSDVAGMERGGRCSVYFCDPMRADQKGGCEKNHVELRKIIPKGTSIDGLGLDPWIMGGICSHANSSLRLSIGDASPAALAEVCLPRELLDGLGVRRVPPAEVETRPELIGRLRAERDRAAGA